MVIIGIGDGDIMVGAVWPLTVAFSWLPSLLILLLEGVLGDVAFLAPESSGAGTGATEDGEASLPKSAAAGLGEKAVTFSAKEKFLTVILPALLLFDGLIMELTGLGEKPAAGLGEEAVTFAHFRSSFKVGATTSIVTPGMHWVTGTHTLSAVSEGAIASKSISNRHTRTDVQFRSLVAVGGASSNVVPTTHCVSGAQTRSCDRFGAKDSYSVPPRTLSQESDQSWQKSFADCDGRNFPAAHCWQGSEMFVPSVPRSQLMGAPIACCGHTRPVGHGVHWRAASAIPVP